MYILGIEGSKPLHRSQSKFMPARAIAVLVLLLACAAPTRAGDYAMLANAAKAQIGVTLIYDGSYRRIAFPNGDVPPERGVCTDVVIRAYRALGIDLQRLVHDDIKRAWRTYPNLWGMRGPDPNIDHRRVPNLATFFSRHGEAFAVVADASRFRAGDIVTWRLPAGVPHIGIVAAERTGEGVPLVIHNVGAGTMMEDKLFSYELTGHYRYRG